jgi:hypothetical protein
VESWRRCGGSSDSWRRCGQLMGSFISRDGSDGGKGSFPKKWLGAEDFGVPRRWRGAWCGGGEKWEGDHWEGLFIGLGVHGQADHCPKSNLQLNQRFIKSLLQIGYEFDSQFLSILLVLQAFPEGIRAMAEHVRGNRSPTGSRCARAVAVTIEPVWAADGAWVWEMVRSS